MEFYLVVIIFISCMIVLALLIYYCQEKRTPKYSVNEEQHDIASIALSIGAPDLVHMQDGKPTMYSQKSAPLDLNEYYNQKLERQNRLKNSNFSSAEHDKVYYVDVDDYSDSDTSNSEKIYFAPKTAAYSVARRMSATANIRRVSSPSVVNQRSPEHQKLSCLPHRQLSLNKSPDNETMNNASNNMLDNSQTNQPIINKNVTESDNVVKVEITKDEASDKASMSDDVVNEKFVVENSLLKVPNNNNFILKKKSNSATSLKAVIEEE